MSLFNTNALSRLEYLSLVSRRVFRGELMAQRRSMQTGGGVEFSDHRPYSPGDDFRYIDWNLYARHDELLLKRFQEEQDLHVHLLLDCSPSMAVNEGKKFDLARQLTAALAYIALSDLDQVGVCAFSDGIIQRFPLTRGKSQILSLMNWLTELSVAGTATRLKNLTREFVQQTAHRGMVILLSDFFDPDGFETALDLLRHHHFETAVVQIHDAAEAHPELLGDFEMQDAESGDRQKVTVTEHRLQTYRQRFRDYLDSLTRYCRTHSMDCTITDTSVNFDQVVLKMMQQHRSQR
ncbi:MAG: DUF58 domain-containing protein [Planctomycetaceae bacterium]